MAKALNRPAVVLSGIQNRFELPAFEGAGYSDAYLAFLRTVVFLGTLGIAEDRILRLWHFEKKLLQLLHVDSTGSKPGFWTRAAPSHTAIAACSSATHSGSSLADTSDSPHRFLASLAGLLYLEIHLDDRRLRHFVPVTDH